MKKSILSSLVAIAAMMAGTQMANAQVEPENDGVYYLYNVECGKYLTRGSYWGTKATTQPVGLPWKVSVAEGKYTLRMYDITVAGGTSGFQGSYTDTANPFALTPTGSAAAGYTLENGGKYIKSDGYNVEMEATADTWQFLTQEQYAAKLAADAAANEAAIAATAGIDLSGTTLKAVLENEEEYVGTTTDDGTPTAATWPVTGVPSRGGNQNWGNYGGEIYQGGGWYSKTLTGLKEGVYKVVVRGLKRCANNENCVIMGNAGYPISDAYMQANGVIIPIKSWYEDRVDDGNPNNTAQFLAAVQQGRYKSEGYVYVGADGKLEMKAAAESFWGGFWFLFNGVEYTYYQSTSAAVDFSSLNTLIGEANTYYASLDAAKAYAIDLKAAIDAAQEVADNAAATQAEVNQAESDLRQAITAAKLAARKEQYVALENGNYILAHNIEMTHWLASGNSWGTQASVLSLPDVLEITQLESGKYNIKTEVSNGGNNQYFNGSYMDGAATAFEFLVAEGGNDNLQALVISDGEKYYGVGEGTTMATLDQPEVWYLTTAAYYEEQTQDYTLRVKDHDFGRNNVGNSAWTQENVQSAGDVTNKVFESWHKDAFSMSQVITDLPEGTYRLTANAFHNNAEFAPVLFANDELEAFPLMEEGITSAAVAAERFAAGDYAVSVEVVVTGDLTIGFRSEDNSNDWCIWDCVRLQKVSDNVTGIHTLSSAAAGQAIYSLNGTQRNALERGINIVRRNGMTTKVVVK